MKITGFIAALMLLLMAAGSALAAQERIREVQASPSTEPGQASQGQMNRPGAMLGGSREAVLGEIQEVEAKIVAVNKHERTVTLEGPQGRMMTVKVDKKVRQFRELKIGDTIKAQYFQAVVLGVAEEGSPEADAEDVTVRAPRGKEPSELKVATIHMRAKVDSVDAQKRTVTLSGPEGETKTLKLGEGVDLEKFKAGETINVRYITGIALELEKKQ